MTCCRPTAVWTSSRGVATSGQSYLSLAHALFLHYCHVIALTTVGTYNRTVHLRTVSNRLYDAGIRACSPYVGPPQTRARRMRRMAWLTAHAPPHPSQRFPMRQRRRVLFTDESRFSLFFTQLVDVPFTDVVGNASPTLDLGVVLVWSGEAFLTVYSDSRQFNINKVHRRRTLPRCSPICTATSTNFTA